MFDKRHYFNLYFVVAVTGLLAGGIPAWISGKSLCARSEPYAFYTCWRWHSA